MSIQIGKLLPDGSVRHIKALHETLSKRPCEETPGVLSQ